MNDGFGGLTGGVMNSVDRDVADIVNHTTAVVHQDIYALNDEFIEGFQWVAALDGDTCPICAGYDNVIFDRLPGIEGEGTMMPEQPAHPNCRCMTVPVMRGTRDIHENGPKYEDWFEGQKEERKLDILGPSRYAMYKQGRKVTRFAADGRTMTLEQLKAERIRASAMRDADGKITDASVNAAVEAKAWNKAVETYPDNMAAGEMQKVFMERWPGIEVELAGKMRDENLRLLVREYDVLLREYPVNGKTLLGIRINDKLGIVPGEYTHNDGVISFSRAIAGSDLKQYVRTYGKDWASRDENHAFLHEFAHPIDRLLGYADNGKLGRQLLLEAVVKTGQAKSWRAYALKLSNYATRIPNKTPKALHGGEFFAEAFASWRNGKLTDGQQADMEWLVDFFEHLPLP